MSKKAAAIQAIRDLTHFMPSSQLDVMAKACAGEEAEFFYDKLIELAETVNTMPKTHEQDGLDDEAIAYLHYFGGPYDAYITERDMGDDEDEVPGAQTQAFGLRDIGYGASLGYVCITELLSNPMMNLDLHFEPMTIGEIKAQRNGQAA